MLPPLIYLVESSRCINKPIIANEQSVVSRLGLVIPVLDNALGLLPLCKFIHYYCSNLLVHNQARHCL